MPHVCDDTIPYLLGEGGILEEINGLKTLHDTKIDSGTEGNDEINNIKINLSNILIDSLDDAKLISKRSSIRCWRLFLNCHILMM